MLNIKKNYKLTKPFIYIKYYKYLNMKKNITNYYIEKYNNLKIKMNKKKKRKIIFNKKVIYYHLNIIKGGLLKVLN
jgi:hypothetical protein